MRVCPFSSLSLQPAAGALFVLQRQIEKVNGQTACGEIEVAPGFGRTERLPADVLDAGQDRIERPVLEVVMGRSSSSTVVRATDADVETLGVDHGVDRAPVGLRLGGGVELQDRSRLGGRIPAGP